MFSRASLSTTHVEEEELNVFDCSVSRVPRVRLILCSLPSPKIVPITRAIEPFLVPIRERGKRKRVLLKLRSSSNPDPTLSVHTDPSVGVLVKIGEAICLSHAGTSVIPASRSACLLSESSAA